MDEYPVVMHTAVDASDARALAEFYRRLLGLRYRKGDAPAENEHPGQAEWLVLLDNAGRRVMAIQRSDNLVPASWPSSEVPMQMHMDFRVSTLAALERHWARAEELGARLLLDRTDDADEPTVVLADPAGHPFCLLVSEG